MIREYKYAWWSNKLYLWLWVLSGISGACKTYLSKTYLKKRLSIMSNANEVTGENPYWRKILDHPCRIVIVVNSRSGKTNALLNLINHHNIDKFSFYVKYKYKSSYQYLINKYQEIGQINLITLTLSMNTQMM